MEMQNMRTYIILFQCKDQKGIVARISEFIFRHGGNIITFDQHSSDPSGGDFFVRAEFVIEDKGLDKISFEQDLAEVAQVFQAQAKIYDKADILRMGIMVSEPDHCLFELLYLWKSEELRVDIPFVISNYQKHEAIVRQHNIPFYYVAANKDERKENEILRLVKPKSDFLVLARYMLVLSAGFLKDYGKDIINIHHGFLPSFKGLDPYREALQKGVKVIGATAHFISEILDEGPIISQVVAEVSHKDSLEVLVRKGKNLEKRALAEAVLRYIDYRIIRHANKTIVF